MSFGAQFEGHKTASNKTPDPLKPNTKTKPTHTSPAHTHKPKQKTTNLLKAEKVVAVWFGDFFPPHKSKANNFHQVFHFNKSSSAKGCLKTKAAPCHLIVTLT